MRRWIVFLVTFIGISGIFILFTGEGVEQARARPPSAFARDPGGAGGWVMQLVDEKAGRLQGVLRAEEFELIGDLIEEESFEGLRLRTIDFELFRYVEEQDGRTERRSVRMRAPTGTLSGGDLSGGDEMRGECRGGVTVEFVEEGASLRTEGISFVTQGSTPDQGRRTISTRSADGTLHPVVLEGFDPFVRIEAAGAEAQLDRATGGRIVLQPPVRARADAAVAERLALIQGKPGAAGGGVVGAPELKPGEEVELECAGPLVLEGFLEEPDPAAGIGMRLLFDGRTTLAGTEGVGGEMEADRLEIHLLDRDGRKEVDRASASAAGDGRVRVRHESFLLLAPSVKWDTTTGLVRAEGGVRVEDLEEGRRIDGDTLEFSRDRLEAILRGNVRGEVPATAPGADGKEERPAPGEAEVWQFFADAFQLDLDEKGKFREGQVWTEGRDPLVITDARRTIQITGQGLRFQSDRATLRGGEDPCTLVQRMGERQNRFRADRVVLETLAAGERAGRVRLLGTVRGRVHPGDLGEVLPGGLVVGGAKEGAPAPEVVRPGAPEEAVPVDVRADEVILVFAAPGREGADGPGDPDGAGGVDEDRGEDGAATGVGRQAAGAIRSIEAIGREAVAEIRSGARAIEGERLVWNREEGILEATGESTRPRFREDDGFDFRAGQATVRATDGIATLTGGADGWLVDPAGERWRLGADALVVRFDPIEEGSLERPEIRSVEVKGRDGKDIWIESNLGRLESAEAVWDPAAERFTLGGPAGFRFIGTVDPTRPSVTFLRGDSAILDLSEGRMDIRGSVRATILPGEMGTAEGLEAVDVDVRSPWHFRCETAWLELEEPEAPLDKTRELPIRQLELAAVHAHGGEGSVVIEAEGSPFRMTGKQLVFDRKDGWARLTGTEGFPPGLEEGDVRRNRIEAREIRWNAERAEAVLVGEVRAKIHSESIRERLPEEEDRIPGLLWELESEKVTVSLGDGGLSDIAAGGPLVFRAGSLEVQAREASFDAERQVLVFLGDPVRASDGQGSGTATKVICDLAREEISAEEAKNWRINPKVLQWRKRE